jgi:hypothetical protein
MDGMGRAVWQVTKRWLQASGIEFWLPLPFVAIAFWFGCSLLTAQELSQSHTTKNKLQADTQLEVHVSVNVSVINAVINRKQGITRVRVETVEPILRRLELEFPMTEVNQVEATIAQELGISREDVRQLVRYEIIN